MLGLFTRLQYYDCLAEPQRGLKANINCSEASDPSSNPAVAVILLWKQVVSAMTARKCSHCGRARLRTPAALHIRALVQHSWTICCSEAPVEYSEVVHDGSEAVVRASPLQGRVHTSCHTSCLVLHSIYTQTTANMRTASMDTAIVCKVWIVSSVGRAPT